MEIFNNKEEFCKFYNENYKIAGIAGIARMCKTSRNTIYKYVKRFGLPIKGQARLILD